jgi:hypothetical protein
MSFSLQWEYTFPLSKKREVEQIRGVPAENLVGHFVYAERWFWFKIMSVV